MFHVHSPFSAHCDGTVLRGDAFTRAECAVQGSGYTAAWGWGARIPVIHVSSRSVGECVCFQPLPPSACSACARKGRPHAHTLVSLHARSLSSEAGSPGLQLIIVRHGQSTNNLIQDQASPCMPVPAVQIVGAYTTLSPLPASRWNGACARKVMCAFARSHRNVAVVGAAILPALQPTINQSRPLSSGLSCWARCLLLDAPRSDGRRSRAHLADRTRTRPWSLRKGTR